MTHDELKPMLADYLGDELNAEQRQQFEAALDIDPEFAAEVDGLRQTLQTIRSLDEPVVAIVKQDKAARPAIMPSLLRYAAVLVFAFVGGYLVRGPQTVQPQLVQQNNTSNVSDWQLKFAKRYSEHPSDSSLARSLVALARSSD
ncbi:MAG: hypothetical protein IH984_09910 [Planctomycetes bacterium]|nr:hypothetical protein [Planctomycetota bacterium]